MFWILSKNYFFNFYKVKFIIYNFINNYSVILIQIIKKLLKILIIIIMFISSNYLFVSGEHSVHFNTNVCSRFCCTPRPFQAYGYPLLLLYLGGFGFHPSLSTGVCAIAAVYFKAISPMTQFHRFLVSLHMHDDLTVSFRISPCPLCSLLWISGLRHSTEIDSCL